LPSTGCRAKMAHTRQSTPYSGLGFQIKPFQVFPLRSETVTLVSPNCRETVTEGPVSGWSAVARRASHPAAERKGEHLKGFQLFYLGASLTVLPVPSLLDSGIEAIEAMFPSLLNLKPFIFLFIFAWGVLEWSPLCP